jgi:heptosyltransferase-2
VKVLFVKLGAIGDVLMARGLPMAVRRAHPNARFTWMAGQGLAPLLARFDGVDEILGVDDAALLAGRPPAKAWALLGAWAALRGRAFDRVLIGHADPRYGLVALAARGPRTAFQSGAWPRPGRWHGDEYVRLFTLQDSPPAERRPLPRLQAPLPAALRRALGRGRKALLFPGGARNLLRDDHLRRWPLEHYAALARLLRRRGWSVALGGAAGDAWVRPAFAGLGLADLLGRCDLPQTLGLCAAADHVVTHDSGPLHLAQASGVRVTALFGPTQPHEKVDPDADVRVLWGGADLTCRPCYDGRAYAACADPACLRGVTPGQVLKTMER